ncbi:MAG TPA: AAA family ATPase [Acetobacteraceae bacterium]|jgi:predicted ATPase|nr:AAA family ATPase [Acetobacteraceae bacterium]
MLFLSELRRRPGVAVDGHRFPWSLPLVRDLERLEFTTPITFLVGENGSGKSTLLEGMAVGIDAVAAGAHDLQRDPTLQAARDFAAGFVFARRRHARTRLFLRTEDMFGYTGRLSANISELEAIEQDFAALPEGPGRDRATGLARGERTALTRRYGENPDGKSHGETFLAMLQTRLVPNGLYILDEPETPLSPSRVLALIAMLAGCVKRGCQFIIATHSPLLMATPDATIVLVEDGRLRSVAWDDLEHVRVTRAFMRDPAAVLRQLLKE